MAKLTAKIKLFDSENAVGLSDNLVISGDNLSHGSISGGLIYRGVGETEVYRVTNGRTDKVVYRNIIYNIEEGTGAGERGNNKIDIFDKKSNIIMQIEKKQEESLSGITQRYIILKSKEHGIRIIDFKEDKQLYHAKGGGLKYYKDSILIMLNRESRNTLEKIMAIQNGVLHEIKIDRRSIYLVFDEFYYNGNRITGILFKGKIQDELEVYTDTRYHILGEGLEVTDVDINKVQLVSNRDTKNIYDKIKSIVSEGKENQQYNQKVNKRDYYDSNALYYIGG